MSVCIGNNCYDQVRKNNTVYFIQSLVYSQTVLNTETNDTKLTQMSEFVFDIVTRAGCIHEMIKRPS
jgi:hypothetical protein